MQGSVAGRLTAEIVKASLTGIWKVKGSLARDAVQTTQDLVAMIMILLLA